MNKREAEAARARCEAATEPFWWIGCITDSHWRSSTLGGADFEFAKNARTDLPAALDMLFKLMAVAKRVAHQDSEARQLVQEWEEN